MTSTVLHRGIVVMLISVSIVTVLMVAHARFARTSGVALVASYVVAMVVLGQT